MKKEEFVKKWLDHSLNDEERKKLSEKENFRDLYRLDAALQHFKSPDFQHEKGWDRLSLDNNQLFRSKLVKTILRIAAIVLIAIGVSLFFINEEEPSMVYLSSKETKEYSFPDQSTVMLNSGSSIAYDENRWDKNRYVTLIGEGYFEVEKGVPFEVMVTSGKVRVLGTSFNILDRKSYFEVTCYEGSVGVTSGDNYYEIGPGEAVRVLNGRINQLTSEDNSPPWLEGYSRFDNIPLKYVLEEIERQYEVNIASLDIDEGKLYSGSFTHDDLELAIETVTLPFNVNFSVKDDLIILTRAD